MTTNQYKPDGVNSIAFSNRYFDILAIGNEDFTTKLCEIKSFGGPINLKLLATVKKMTAQLFLLLYIHF
jgi:hypothetical protein